MDYTVTLPVEIDVELSAANDGIADQKAAAIVAWFLEKLTPYKIATPEFGAFTLTLQPDREEADEPVSLDGVTPDDIDHTQPYTGSALVLPQAIIADRSVDLTGEFLPTPRSAEIEGWHGGAAYGR